MRIAALVTCTLSFGVLGIATAMTQSPEPAVRIAFQTEREIVLHQPVVIRLLVQNQLRSPVSIDLGTNRSGNVWVQVRRPDGSVVTPSAPFQTGVVRLGRITLDAGAAYTQQIHLDDWLALDAPGDYEVRIGLSAPAMTAAGKVAFEPGTDIFRIRIGQRDQQKLREVSERLVAQAISEPSYEARADAARALSRVGDPVAVPSLEAVFRATDSVDSFVIQGLSRIGTADARAALTEMASSPDEGRAAMGANALARFRLRTP